MPMNTHARYTLNSSSDGGVPPVKMMPHSPARRSVEQAEQAEQAALEEQQVHRGDEQGGRRPAGALGELVLHRPETPLVLLRQPLFFFRLLCDAVGLRAVVFIQEGRLLLRLGGRRRRAGGGRFAFAVAVFRGRRFRGPRLEAFAFAGGSSLNAIVSPRGRRWRRTPGT